jgi:hypothetical protein
MYNLGSLIDEGTKTRTIMKFSIKEWRSIYDKVHELGAKLHDSRPTSTDKGGYIPPFAPLSKDEQADLEVEIMNLTRRSQRYLDQCGLTRRKPLWHYDRHDPRTWASHESFKYGHLLPFKEV